MVSSIFSPYLLGVFLLARSFHFSLSEVFTSTAHITDLIPQEKALKNSLFEYIQDEERRVARIGHFLSRNYGVNPRSNKNSTQHDRKHLMTNPIQLIINLKRFVQGWKQVTYELNKSKAFSQDKYFKARNNTTSLHTISKIDILGAARGLLRLQKLYELDVQSLASGVPPGGIHVTPMTARDYYDIGRTAYLSKNDVHVKGWMQEALRINEKEGNDKEVTLSALDHLAFSEYKNGNHTSALEAFKKISLLDPSYYTTRINESIRKLRIDIKSKKAFHTSASPNSTTANINRTAVKDEQAQENQVYEDLCRGLRTNINDQGLHCEYLRNHPSIYLKPIAMEVLYREPKIVVFYDILSEKQIKTVKRLAVPRLRRATVNNIDTGAQEMVNYRISKSAWLVDTDDDVIKRINKRVEIVTGLSVKTAEDLQIANYGLGGYYEFHLDYAKNMNTSAVGRLGTGNRVATVLFYLNDVEAGGATVFGHLGVRAIPKKGSAVFWYNLHKSGQGDPLTMHAACPVLVGSKWVANKWLHELGQEFRRPCGLRPDE